MTIILALVPKVFWDFVLFFPLIIKIFSDCNVCYTENINGLMTIILDFVHSEKIINFSDKDIDHNKNNAILLQ